MEITPLTVTPDRHLPVHYAGASGDFNPIHFDEAAAQAAGLPSTILHGLYSMALLARTLTEAGGGPGSLKSLSVQFRGMAFPDQEITVTAEIESDDGDTVVATCQAEQGGRPTIKNGRATLTRG